jgi:hypothetical protein
MDEKTVTLKYTVVQTSQLIVLLNMLEFAISNNDLIMCGLNPGD